MCRHHSANQSTSGQVILPAENELAMYKAMRVSAAYNGPLHFWQTTRGLLVTVLCYSLNCLHFGELSSI